MSEYLAWRQLPHDCQYGVLYLCNEPALICSSTPTFFNVLRCNFLHAGLPLKQRLMFGDGRLPLEHSESTRSLESKFLR